MRLAWGNDCTLLSYVNGSSIDVSFDCKMYRLNEIRRWGVQGYSL